MKHGDLVKINIYNIEGIETPVCEHYKDSLGTVVYCTSDHVLVRSTYNNASFMFNKNNITVVKSEGNCEEIW